MATAAQVSQRVLETDAPIIAKVKAIMASRPDALSLAQGIVHWQPPPEALQVLPGAPSAPPKLRTRSSSPCAPC